MRNRKNSLLWPVMALALAGCEGTGTSGTSVERELVPVVPGVVMPTTTPQAARPAPTSRSYRFVVEAYSPQPVLQEAATTLLMQQPALAAATRPGAGMFRLHLLAQAQTQQTALPRLVGKLEKTQLQPRYKVSFVLTGQAGSVLTQGSTEVTGPAQEVVYPAPPVAQSFTPALAKTAMAQVLPQILPYIQSSPWQAQVFSVVNPSHIALALGPESGLRVGDILETTTLPLARLQVVSFERPSSESMEDSRAVLRLMVGQLPQPGRFLAPAQGGK